MKIMFGWDLMYRNLLESSVAVMEKEFNCDQIMVYEMDDHE